jgi:hypothetical protein
MPGLQFQDMGGNSASISGVTHEQIQVCNDRLEAMITHGNHC